MDKPSDPGALFDRIEWARNELGLSPNALALHLQSLSDGRDGFSSSTVHRYHTRQRRPPMAYLTALADAAGVDRFWLISGEGTPYGPAPGPGYAEGIRWALTEVEKATTRIREAAGTEARVEGRPVPILEAPSTDLALLIQLDAFVARAEVQTKAREGGAEDALAAGIALMEQHFIPNTDPSDAEMEAWRLYLGLLPEGYRDAVGVVEWTTADVAAMGLLPESPGPDTT